MKCSIVCYGDHRGQVGEIWRPDATGHDRPVVVLIHGGFWRQLYTKRLMHQMAHAVVERGWIAYNIEYRRVGPFGGGGWPETFEDVASAIDALASVEGIDLGRVVTCGHSAGGHLALWAASSRSTSVSSPGVVVPVHTAIALAGVVDLHTAARLDLGSGAVHSLLSGSPESVPERYALSSPSSLLPLGVPQILIHGTADRSVPVSLSSTYVDHAIARGDDATFIPLRGAGHMEMIQSSGAAFPEIAKCLDKITGQR